MPTALETFLADLRAPVERDPAADGWLDVVLSYPGFHAITMHRMIHALWKRRIPLLPRLLSEAVHRSTGIDIHPGATIGPGFFIDHGTGVVIGETTIIGRRVRLYQAVTLGARRFEQDEQGALLKRYPRHPIIEDDVVIYAGATILGRITIGQGSTIAGNVWVTSSAPAGSTITQAKARSDGFDDGGGI